MSSLEITVRFGGQDAGFTSMSNDVLRRLRAIRREAGTSVRVGGFVSGGRGSPYRRGGGYRGGGGGGDGGGYGGGAGARGAVSARRAGRRRRAAGANYLTDEQRERRDIDRVIRRGRERRDIDPIRDLDRAGARVHHTGLAMERAGQRSRDAMMALVDPTIRYERAITDAVAVVGDALSGPKAKQNEDRLRALSQGFADIGVTSIQAADSIEFFGMANFSTADIEKNLKTTFLLARAGHTDQALAADLQTDIATSFFGEKGAKDQMTRTADVLTSTFTTANTNLRLLGSTLLTVGPIARQAGLDLETTAGAASVLAGNGIKGSKAGTDMRMMLLKLQNPTKAARKEWRRLGLDYKDVAKDMQSGDFAAGLKKVDEALARKGPGFNRARFFAKAFGSRPSGSAVKLVEAAGTGELQEKIATARASAGTTAQVAGKKLDSDAAKFDIAKAKLIQVATTLGHVLIPELIPVAEGFIEIAQGVADFSKAHPGAIKAFTKLIVTMTVTTSVLGPLVTTFGGLMRMGALMQQGLGGGPTGLGGTMAGSAGMAGRMTGQVGRLTAALGTAGLLGAMAGLGWQIGRTIDDITGASDRLSGGKQTHDDRGLALAGKRGTAMLSKAEHAAVKEKEEKLRALEAAKAARGDDKPMLYSFLSEREQRAFDTMRGGLDAQVVAARRDLESTRSRVQSSATKRRDEEDAKARSMLQREAGIIDAARGQADEMRQKAMFVRSRRKQQDMLSKADKLDEEAGYRESSVQRIMEREHSRLLPTVRDAEGRNTRGSWRGAIEVTVNTTTGQSVVTQGGRPIGPEGVQVP